MFNMVINNEQYDEYLAQQEKIKELEARNEFLKEQYDQLNEKYQANSDHYQSLYEELVRTNKYQKEKFDIFYADYLDAIKKCNTLEEQVDHWKMQFESTYKNYQRALSDKVALIEERDRLKEQNAALEDQNKALSNLCDRRGEKLKAKDDEISKRCEQLYKACAELESVKAKINEPIGMIKINPCRDSDEAYLPDNNRNINIENLYLTNNYFSEEDKK